MSPTDMELIEQSNAGSISAFEQLMYRYDKEVLTIAARFTSSADDAKDIYQETFIRVFHGLPKFRRESSFSTWIFRIATNVCLSYRQKKRRTEFVPFSDGGEEEGGRLSAVSSDETDALLRKSEISQKIDEGLARLSPQQRLVFTLRHYSDYKIKDIAVLMECAEGTVKKYLFEAMQRMRTHLHDVAE